MTYNFYKERYISAQDGITLYYRIYNQTNSRKTPVLCLSGLTRNSRDFDELAISLSSQRKVITIDYRGRGKSEYDSNWRNYQPKTYVNDIRGLVTALNLDKFFVVGTSLGGIIAMGMGVAMPSSLKGVLLNDIGPEISLDGLTKIRLYLSKKIVFKCWDEVAKNFQLFFPKTDAQSYEDLINNIKRSYTREDNFDIVQSWDKNISKMLERIDLSDTDLWPLFLSLRRIPLIVLRGEYSNVLTVKTLNKMMMKNPDMKAVTIPGIGHAPTLLETTSKESLYGILDEIDDPKI